MVVQVAGALVALMLALVLVKPLIRYRIGRRHVFITLLGVPLRWISLRNIRYISDHTRDRYESWANVYCRKNRSLFIRKRSGFFRSVHITPAKRFVFKADLEKAIRNIDPKASLEETGFFERHLPSGKLPERAIR